MPLDRLGLSPVGDDLRSFDYGQVFGFHAALFLDELAKHELRITTVIHALITETIKNQRSAQKRRYYSCQLTYDECATVSNITSGLLAVQHGPVVAQIEPTMAHVTVNIYANAWHLPRP